jgi:hypothetical protein
MDLGLTLQGTLWALLAASLATAIAMPLAHRAGVRRERRRAALAADARLQALHRAVLDAADAAAGAAAPDAVAAGEALLARLDTEFAEVAALADELRQARRTLDATLNARPAAATAGRPSGRGGFDFSGAAGKYPAPQAPPGPWRPGRDFSGRLADVAGELGRRWRETGLERLRAARRTLGGD